VVVNIADHKKGKKSTASEIKGKVEGLWGLPTGERSWKKAPDYSLGWAGSL